jgi:hypothetical protein
MLELHAEQPAADWDWKAHYAPVKARLNSGVVRARPAKIYDEPIGPRVVVRDILNLSSIRRAKWRDIVSQECARGGVALQDILSSRRKASFVAIRRRICWRIKNETMMSYPQIGEALNRDHTTILHHVHKYQRMIDEGRAQP